MQQELVPVGRELFERTAQERALIVAVLHLLKMIERVGSPVWLGVYCGSEFCELQSLNAACKNTLSASDIESDIVSAKPRQRHCNELEDMYREV